MRRSLRRPQLDGGAPRRHRAVLLGVAGVALAAALPVALRPHSQQGAVSAQRQAGRTAEGQAPGGFGGALSPARPLAVGDSRSPDPAVPEAARRAGAAPGPGAQVYEPPSPVDTRAFNGVGFSAPGVRPQVTPVVRADAIAPDRGVMHGPLYYSSIADAVRVTQESQKMDQPEGRLHRGAATE